MLLDEAGCRQRDMTQDNGIGEACQGSTVFPADAMIRRGQQDDAALAPLVVALRGGYGVETQVDDVIDNDGTDAISGTFHNLPEGTRWVDSQGFAYEVTYQGGDGNDVDLEVTAVAIPA